jgi:hypothetical protein
MEYKEVEGEWVSHGLAAVGDDSETLVLTPPPAPAPQGLGGEVGVGEVWAQTISE